MTSPPIEVDICCSLHTKRKPIDSAAGVTEEVTSEVKRVPSETAWYGEVS